MDFLKFCETLDLDEDSHDSNDKYNNYFVEYYKNKATRLLAFIEDWENLNKRK